jgi:hypothetical protein
VDGSGLARTFFTHAGWSVQPCVRPFSAVHMTAGHNALRGSGPGQKPAFKMRWHEWVVLIAGSRRARLDGSTYRRGKSVQTTGTTSWRQIRTNNPLERILREIRRRTRMVGAFPDGIELPKDQQMRGAPSPLESVPGAAQPNTKVRKSLDTTKVRFPSARVDRSRSRAHSVLLSEVG